MDFPTLNASLNGLAGVLIVVGWVAVRTGRIGLHKVMMLLALVVSAVFLGCYVYFHIFIKKGQPTEFAVRNPAAPYWAGKVYLGILLSHTILAAVVTPVAIYVAYLGYKDRLDRHRRLARWTVPVWLYVSVTGVVVYLMLYRIW